MNIQINTDTKTIRVLGDTPVLELITFLEQYRGMGYKVVPNNDSRDYNQPIGIPNNPYKTWQDPYAPPYTVNCGTGQVGGASILTGVIN